MKILIVGDSFFRPEDIKKAIEVEIGNLGYNLDIDVLKLPYPDPQLLLTDESVISSGMSWDAHPSVDFERYKVKEHYGVPELLVNHIGETEILVVHGAAVPRQVMERGKKLKLIYCLRGGPVNIDIEAAKEFGVKVMNSPGKNAEAVAELIIGLLLNHLRKVFEAQFYLKQGIWKTGFYDYDYAGVEIRGKVFGIVGLGKIGKSLAHLLKGFDCELLGYDPMAPLTSFSEEGVKKVDLQYLLENSDFISLNARLPQNSVKLIREEELSMMKSSAILINTARGDLLDYKALYRGLIAGRPAGAVLDVFGADSFGFYKKLINLPCVTATPHICGISKETIKRGIEKLTEQLKDYISNFNKQ